jgi:hypothetical protein
MEQRNASARWLASRQRSPGRIELAEESAMTDREEHIRRRAYEIWEREGRPDGRHLDHWHLAASQIEEEEGGTAAAQSAAPTAGISSSLQPSGTAPGGGPGASQGSIGSGGDTGGGSAGSTGDVEGARRSRSSP